MKILIIGPLGAGKSSLAYAINKKFNLPRLNIDEICRKPEDGSYYPLERQFAKMGEFLQSHESWVAEGCQKYLYEKMTPDLVIDMRVHRLVAIWRFTVRFIRAKKLVGKEIDKNLPVQAYHYRKISLQKIREYDAANQEIKYEITAFLQKSNAPVLKCKSFKDYDKIFAYLEKQI